MTIEQMNEFSDTYVSVWNESNAQKRREIIMSLWAEDGMHSIPSSEYQGYEELMTRITKTYEQFVASGDFSFRSSHNANGQHGSLKFNWEMVSREGDVVSIGFDFLLLDANNKIKHDYQYIEN